MPMAQSQVFRRQQCADIEGNDEDYVLPSTKFGQPNSSAIEMKGNLCRKEVILLKYATVGKFPATFSTQNSPRRSGGLHLAEFINLRQPYSFSLLQ